MCNESAQPKLTRIQKAFEVFCNAFCVIALVGGTIAGTTYLAEKTPSFDDLMVKLHPFGGRY